MSDGLDLLVKDDRLVRLLAHYQSSAGDNREAWSDRVSDWDGGRPDDLARWHGVLLASAWIEQNTGHAPAVGRAVQCYRVTAAGRQALKRVQERNECDA